MQITSFLIKLHCYIVCYVVVCLLSVGPNAPILTKSQSKGILTFVFFSFSNVVYIYLFSSLYLFLLAFLLIGQIIHLLLAFANKLGGETIIFQ